LSRSCMRIVSGASGMDKIVIPARAAMTCEQA
jgi:hypothetical protein